MATEALLAVIILWVDKLFSERGERGIFNFLSFIENNMKIFGIEELRRRKNHPSGQLDARQRFNFS